MTPIGLAHLTLLRLSPPEFVTTAAAFGFATRPVADSARQPGVPRWPSRSAPASCPAPTEVAARLREYRDAGMDHAVIGFSPVTSTEQSMDLFQRTAAPQLAVHGGNRRRT